MELVFPILTEPLLICDIKVTDSVISFFPSYDVIRLVNNDIFVAEYSGGDINCGLPNIAFVPFHFSKEVVPVA